MSRAPAKAPARKPSPSTKYSGVASKIDTGAVASREEANFARFRHDRRTEDFKRIKAASLAKLISESHPSESIYQLGRQAPSAHRERSYLLLDIRVPEEYEKYHIRDAKCHPLSVLTRSVNQFTAEIIEFKNQVDKMIIIYDEDEKSVLAGVDIFIRSQYDNIYILEGGIRTFLESNIHLVDGHPPVKTATPATSAGRTTTRRGQSPSLTTRPRS